VIYSRFYEKMNRNLGHIAEHIIYADRLQALRTGNRRSLRSNTPKRRNKTSLKMVSNVLGEVAVAYKHSHEGFREWSFMQREIGKQQCISLMKKNAEHTRTPEMVEKLKTLAKCLDIIKDVNDSDLQRMVCQSMKVTSLPLNSLIYVQGQEASSYFVLLEGSVSIYFTHFRVKQKQLSDMYGTFTQEETRQVLDPGTNMSLYGQKTAQVPIEKGFGEVPKGQTEWSSTAIATMRSEVLEIPMGLYQQCLQMRDSPHLGMEDGVNFLHSVPLFESAKTITLSDITYRLHFRHYQRGEVVVKGGDPINMIFMVYSGEASVKQKFTVSSTDLYYHTKGHTVEYEICKSISGALIGALDVLEGRDMHSYTVHASTALDILEMSIMDLQQFVDKYPSAATKFRYQEKERLKARQPPKLDNYVQNIVAAETMTIGDKKKRCDSHHRTERRKLAVDPDNEPNPNTQSLNSMFSTHLRTMSIKPPQRKPKHHIYIPGEQPSPLAQSSPELPTLMTCTSDLMVNNKSHSAPVSPANPALQQRPRSVGHKEIRPEFFDLRPTKNLPINLDYLTGSAESKPKLNRGASSMGNSQSRARASTSSRSKSKVPSPTIPLRSGAKYSVIL